MEDWVAGEGLSTMYLLTKIKVNVSKTHEIVFELEERMTDGAIWLNKRVELVKKFMYLG